MYNLYGILIGILIALTVICNGVLSNSMGNYSATVIIHAVGLIAMTLILCAKKIKIDLSKKVSIYLYTGGAIGIFTVLANNISFKYLGVSLTIALGLLGQTITSIIIDHFGFFKMKVVKFRKEKLFGIALIIGGIIVMTMY